jgi:hypothetical protein
MSFFRKTLPLNQESADKLSEAISKNKLPEFAAEYRPTLAHFLIKNEADVTPLHRAATTGHLDQVTEVLKAFGERLAVEHLFIESDDGHTPFGLAALYSHLDHIFTPSLWTGRVGEMITLWDQVSEQCREQVDFEAVLKEAILQSVRPERTSALDGAGMTRSTSKSLTREEDNSSQERLRA